MTTEPSGPFARTAAPAYTVSVPGYEGPLDLLVTLANQGKIDLNEIPLAEMADEFLRRSKESLDLNQAVETLWLLAALVEMKARSLLPKPPPPELIQVPEDGHLPERLEEQLAEYRAFKEAAEALRVLESLQQQVFVRPRQGEPADILLEGVTVEDLFQAFEEVLARAREERAAEVVDEPVRVADRMSAILGALDDAPHGLEFSALFPRRATTVVVVVTFLALLELIMGQKVRVQQASPLALIMVKRA